jgi:type II secretory pathway component PulC
MAESNPLSRVSALAAPVLILLVLGVGSFVGVVRYTSVLDPRSGAMATDEHHRDPKPCLRYAKDPGPAAIRLAAEELSKAGVTSLDVSDLVGDLYARAETREAALHPLAQEDEQLEAFGRASLRDRLVIAVKRDLIRAELVKLLKRTPAVTTRIVDLPPEKRAAVEAEWARDPSVFILPGLIGLVRELKWVTSKRRLEVIFVELEDQLEAGKQPSLEALTTPERDDDWGHPFTLERTGEDEFTLASLGADGFAGGTGHDADLTRKLMLKPGLAPPPPAEELPATCTGKTELTLARSEVNSALQNLAEVTKGVRVTPAVSNGVVSGFRLTKLRAQFLLEAGLCDGDVVSTLNGVPLTSPDKALEAYSVLKGAKRVEIGVTRGGKPLTLTVTLR